MASVTELTNSRSGTSSSHQRRYLAQGYTTEALAIAAVNSFAPSALGDLALVEDETSVDELHYDNTDSSWIATCNWKLFEPSSGLNYSFQIGGTQIQTSFPISQTKYYISGAGTSSVDATSVGINYDGDEVGGVSLPEKSGFEFVIPARKPIADVDNTYVNAVADLYLKVNDATFAGFAAGEVLFLGVSGSRVGESDWQLYYRFARSQNLPVSPATYIEIKRQNTPHLRVTSKEGWEYLWIYYGKEKDAQNWLQPDPVFAYVAQVFEDGDFAGLEL